MKAIAIAGPIGSGKTRLAGALCASIGSARASFGDFVRLEAMRLGLGNDRHVLQQLGERLFARLGPLGFVEAVITVTPHRNAGLFVFDAVRHLEVWHAISHLANASILVYMEGEEALRVSLASMRDGVTPEEIKAAARHRIEVEATVLCSFADLLIKNIQLELQVQRVTELARIRGVLTV